jgi:hypothetical protein
VEDYSLILPTGKTAFENREIRMQQDSPEGTREALTRAYRNTTYTVELPPGGEDTARRRPEIRVGATCSALEEILLKHEVEVWAYLTAWNPGSRVLPWEANQARQAGLEAELRRRKYVFFSGEGRGADPGWEPERSCLVLGIFPQEARELAAHWGQNALVVGQRGGLAELLWVA